MMLAEIEKFKNEDARSNHVEVDHGCDVDGIIFVSLSKVLGSKKTLFLSCYSYECNRGLRVVSCKDSG